MFVIPVVLTFEEQEVRKQLKLRARDAKIFSVKIPFDGTGRLVVAPRQDYLKMKKEADRILAYIDLKIATVPGQKLRLQLWQSEILNDQAKYADWRIILMRWAIKTAPIEAWDGTHISITIDKQNLAAAFLNKTLGLTGTALDAAAKALEQNVQPRASRSQLIDAAFEVQSERDTAELEQYFAPRVALMIVMLFPPADAPVVIGAAITAITGFIQFMETMEDAEADGDISEEELNEAFWAMLGIIPFRLVQDMLLVRGLWMIGKALFSALVNALESLPDYLGKYSAALDGGWSSYGENERDSTIFLPNYVL